MKVILIVITGLLFFGCSSNDSTYTLYRNSVFDEFERIHVATFDASDGHDYNMENCQRAQILFQGQTKIMTKFWCERGKFKK
jgi:hypothetical protein